MKQQMEQPNVDIVNIANIFFYLAERTQQGNEGELQSTQIQQGNEVLVDLPAVPHNTTQSRSVEQPEPPLQAN